MKKFSRPLLLGVSLLAFGVQAQAQDIAPVEGTGEVADEAPAADEDITVTGSRVIRNGNASPSPVTVVSTESLMRSSPGSTLAEALNQLPVFAGSRGSTSNPTTAGSAAGGNGGANQLNLRNLDATRTLVLMDGKRVPPTLFNGVVDVDIIPQLLVERVDMQHRSGERGRDFPSDDLGSQCGGVVDDGFYAEAEIEISTTAIRHACAVGPHDIVEAARDRQNSLAVLSRRFSNELFEPCRETSVRIKYQFVAPRGKAARHDHRELQPGIRNGCSATRFQLLHRAAQQRCHVDTE